MNRMLIVMVTALLVLTASGGGDGASGSAATSDGGPQVELVVEVLEQRAFGDIRFPGDHVETACLEAPEAELCLSCMKDA